MTQTGDRRRLTPKAALALSLLLLSWLICAAPPGQQEEDWASSPEAYFLTREEREEWKKLDSRDSRQAFKERYWLKRDPTPGTARNEFREMVLARIKTADARFPIEKTPGSRTARGLVFLVLGSPARVQDELAPRLAAPAPRQAGQGVTPVAIYEGNERTSTWFYDRDRTPRILEVLERPSLQIKIVIEPSRHLDSIQDPGLFNELREVVARRSVVNPDLVPPADAATGSTGGAELLPRQSLAAAVRQILEATATTSRRESGVVGSAVLFRERGDAETLLWIFTPPPSRRPFFHALVRAEDGREVASVSEPAAISSSFSMHGAGLVALLRLSLPAGSYSASVALTEEGGRALASAMVPLQVPSLASSFAVSSLVLTRGPALAGSGSDRTFTFGGASIPPRGDAVFTPSESLWYFLEIANPSDAGKVLLEPRLRRGAEPVGSLAPFPAKLQEIGLGRYLVGIELPLSSLAPGDYVLYVGVRDGEGEERPRALRRADFQIVR